MAQLHFYSSNVQPPDGSRWQGSPPASSCKSVPRFTRRAAGCKFLGMNTVADPTFASQEPLNHPAEHTSSEASAMPSAEDNPPASMEQVSAEGESAPAGPESNDGVSLEEPPSSESMPLRQVLEALLFASDVPLSAAKIAQTLGLDSARTIKAAVEELNELYNQREAAFRIEERAGGYQILTLPQYAQYIQRLMRKRDEGRLTPAALETLAIIAYKQPILRVDVEAIRGVACGEVIRTLMEYNLVKIVGRAEDVGRPMLYGTSKHFLEVFGLASLKDLPKSDQLKEPA